MAFEPGTSLSKAFADASGVTGTGSVSTPAPAAPTSSGVSLGDAVKVIGTGGTSLLPGFPSLPGASWSRIGAFVLGLIMIAGAIFLFKPTQEIIGRAAI